jgi:glucosamine 6-phosphate synthetase-like amidotransferase/phosphosugar isomerase protein
MIRQNGNWEMFIMIEIEKYPCNDRREAEKRENEIMKELKANMNTNKSSRTKKEYREDNKETIKKKKREYYEDNKEKIQELRKEYYEKNKEKILEKQKDICICSCGCEVNKHHIKRHQQTNKHVNLMNKTNAIKKQ